MRLNLSKIVLPVAIMLLMLPTLSTAQQTDTINDKDIKVIDYVDFGYPAIGVTAHIEGVVVVRVTLDRNGRVLTADALSGAPILVAASVDNVKHWRFEANSSSTAIIIYNFRLRGSCHEGGLGNQLIFYPPNFMEVTACPTPMHAP